MSNNIFEFLFSGVSLFLVHFDFVIVFGIAFLIVALVLNVFRQLLYRK